MNHGARQLCLSSAATAVVVPPMNDLPVLSHGPSKSFLLCCGCLTVVVPRQIGWQQSDDDLSCFNPISLARRDGIAVPGGMHRLCRGLEPAWKLLKKPRRSILFRAPGPKQSSALTILGPTTAPRNPFADRRTFRQVLTSQKVGLCASSISFGVCALLSPVESFLRLFGCLPAFVSPRLQRTSPARSMSSRTAASGASGRDPSASCRPLSAPLPASWSLPAEGKSRCC